MMKKLAITVIIAILCGTIFHVAYAKEPNIVEISTPEGLEAIADDPDGSYLLTADIDMKGVEWTPLAFNGEFDGGGHTICNLTVKKPGDARAVTVDGNFKKYDTVFAGLFSTVKGAVIKDLHLLNANVHITTDENCFAAGLAGFAEDTEISGCTVKGRVYLYQTYKMCGVAGIVGFGHGKITNCAADVELVFVDGDTKIKCEEFLGGILATGYSDIENCTVKLRGYASVQGYVHNGGVVGMYYVYVPADKARVGYVKGCSVDADIFFYENNRDRRAYCKQYAGEKLNHYVKIVNNATVHFKNGETFDYSKYLLPEMCGEPAYAAAVTAPTCKEYGYTTYTCANCGYSYTDDYAPPAHTPGEWVTDLKPTYTETGLERRYCAVCGKPLYERTLPVLPPAHEHTAGDWVVVKEPGYNESGLKRQSCKDCGEILKEEEIPKLIHVSSCEPDYDEILLDYKSSIRLNPVILPVGASNTDVTWSSSDESVATVDGQGNVDAVGKGTVVITCTSADGNVSGTCTIIVDYTFWQWIVVVLLFGWIWY